MAFAALHATICLTDCGLWHGTHHFDVLWEEKEVSVMFGTVVVMSGILNLHQY